MAKRIKITQPGWEGFNGDFGMVEFADGVSVDLVSKRQLVVIAATIAVEEVDEDGNSLGKPGLQDNMDGAAIVPAPVLTPLARASDEDVKAEAKADAKKAKEPKLDPLALTFHSKEELEAIAEKKGIGGLREIGDVLKVKGRSINELVKEILKAESKLKAQADALAASSETTREPETPAPEEPDVVAEGDADETPTEQPEADAAKGTEQSDENEKAPE
ncbi:hypothetical protein [Methylobacterium sp. AMS5]|uniref:hypothetical protein n=1 Tax=Methylobacterium sp. AMS5 TaxID=925818 RepID=UPI00074F87F9|nr:hypothetical protein [Methylobacterium sp. AMS5]AMB48268.1 hypothetical protein Y590_25205 [Methylobacterium sp. AMS5]